MASTRHGLNAPSVRGYEIPHHVHSHVASSSAAVGVAMLPRLSRLVAAGDQPGARGALDVEYFQPVLREQRHQ